MKGARYGYGLFFYKKIYSNHLRNDGWYKTRDYYSDKVRYTDVTFFYEKIQNKYIHATSNVYNFKNYRLTCSV